jgi:nucleoside-diphosphate-sugar epimerase
MNNKILVFGCSGTVGLDFIKVSKNKNTLYYSRKKPKKIQKKLWKYIDLNKKITDVPNKVDKIFFFASPHYKLDNLKKKNIFLKELSWLKKIKKKIKTRVFIYLSSSSVYLNNHPVGSAKLACENYLINNTKKDYLQIWRPYNLIGNENLNLSDHFHNILIKKFCIEKKRAYHFKGSANDERGYSSTKKFCKSLINKSDLSKDFIYDYGNSKSIKVKQIANIFKKIFEKNIKRKIKYTFNSNTKNINTISSNKYVKSFDTKDNSYNIIKKYYLSKIKLYEK